MDYDGAGSRGEAWVEKALYRFGGQDGRCPGTQTPASCTAAERAMRIVVYTELRERGERLCVYEDLRCRGERVKG